MSETCAITTLEDSELEAVCGGSGGLINFTLSPITIASGNEVEQSNAQSAAQVGGSLALNLQGISQNAANFAKVGNVSIHV